MNLPISVWLSAIVLFMISASMAWHNPIVFFKALVGALVFTVVAAAFLRVIYWFIEGE